MTNRLHMTVPVPVNRIVRTYPIGFQFELPPSGKGKPRSLLPLSRTVRGIAPTKFLPRRLIIPSLIGKQILVSEINFGSVNLLVSPVHGDVFSELAIGPPIEFPPLETGEVVSITLLNLGDDILIFRAMLLGENHDQTP